MRDHLTTAVQTAANPEQRQALEEQLYGPPVPEECALLLPTWHALNAARGSNGFGPSPITWTDMRDYVIMTGRPIAPWEADIIHAADIAARLQMADNSRPAKT